MKGIIGAATVVGCLQHGAGVCDEQFTGSPVLVELKARSLASSGEDENFLTALRHSATVKTGEFPPAALVELYHEPGAVAARLRRLHLVIVDLCHPRKTATKIEKKFHRQITCVRDTGAVSITPIPLWNNEEWCIFACTSHAVSPRPGLVKLLALSNFPAFVHCDPCFTGLYGQCCLSFCDILCHRCFFLPDRMRLLSPVSRTLWLLCADPPFFCAP